MIGYSVPLMQRPNRRVWLAKRRRGITATDVPAILGLSDYATPVDVYLDKFGLGSVEVNYAMRRGSVLEALLLTEYATQRKVPLLACPPLVAHPDNRWAMASLDGAAQYTPTEGSDLTGQRLVEVKTASWRDREVWWDQDRQIPDAYLAQVAWQQYVTGVEWADVIVDVAGDVRIIGPIQRDRRLENALVATVWEWWQRHIIGHTPPLTDPVRDYDLMNLLWRPDPEVKTALTEETAPLVETYAVFAENAKWIKGQQAEIRGKVRAAMGTATALVDDNGHKWARIDKAGKLTIKPPATPNTESATA